MVAAVDRKNFPKNIEPYVDIELVEIV